MTAANLLRAERIKLLSTRAPLWCAVIAVVLALAYTALFFGFVPLEEETTVTTTQTASALGRTVVLVLAILTAASEFNWGTMKLSFQAVPSRVPILLAKGVVVGVFSGLIGLLVGFGSWGLAYLIKPAADLGLTSGADWRAVAGQGATFLLTGLLGVGLGLLFRSTGFALGFALVWTQLIEGLVVLIPRVGDDIYPWMPFFAANQFSGPDLTVSMLKLHPPLGPWGYLAYFAGICVVVYTAGLMITHRRDA
ncbi:ABC transporter permease [Amycolatopsis orientalis]|uniref:ABC transporter permease n=1 Tax=Amycolatopsis orientalis TaxID=31958 RepID=UPI00041EEB80|nr:ABC transporter permease [Amycolatopsis orientalis]